MHGVQRGDDGSWAWIAPCGASGGDHATSRDLTRESYQKHRFGCVACKGAAGAPVAAKPSETEVAVPVVEEKKVARAPSDKARAALKREGTVTGRARIKKSNVKDVERPANARQATPAEKAQFTKLVRAAASEHEAWIAVRKHFSREEWGKVREITLACSPYRTFMAAFKDLHRAAS